MAYKFKPNKGIKRRVKLTKTGKIKHRHEMNSHLRSGRSPALKRRLGRAATLDEQQGRRLRRLIGAVGKRPNQVKHNRALAAKKAAEAAAPAEVK
jgi:large subunit ribosomal protein L35